MSFYLDASVLVSTLIEEDRSDAVGRFLRAAVEPICVSNFAAAEVSSALSRLVRMAMLRGDDALVRLAEFDAFRASTASGVYVGRADVALADQFARRFDLGLRVPDALHAAVCRRAGHTLVTLDHRLAEAAHALGLKVESPD